MALGSTQPLTEMSTKNLPGNQERPTGVKADNFTADSLDNESLDVSQPYAPPRPITQIAFFVIVVPCLSTNNGLPIYNLFSFQANTVKNNRISQRHTS
jgi:hypothetical protein